MNTLRNSGVYVYTITIYITLYTIELHLELVHAPPVRFHGFLPHGTIAEARTKPSS